MDQSSEALEPLEFVPVFGSSFDPTSLKGSDLIIPTMSAGGSATIAVDLFVLNENVTKVGYLKSQYISPMLSNDALTVAGKPQGQLVLPCEVYVSADNKKTFIIMRGGICGGRST